MQASVRCIFKIISGIKETFLCRGDCNAVRLNESGTIVLTNQKPEFVNIFAHEVMYFFIHSYYPIWFEFLEIHFTKIKYSVRRKTVNVEM